MLLIPVNDDLLDVGADTVPLIENFPLLGRFTNEPAKVVEVHIAGVLTLLSDGEGAIELQDEDAGVVFEVHPDVEDAGEVSNDDDSELEELDDAESEDPKFDAAVAISLLEPANVFLVAAVLSGARILLNRLRLVRD